jgi:hypothetical protein
MFLENFLREVAFEYGPRNRRVARASLIEYLATSWPIVIAPAPASREMVIAESCGLGVVFANACCASM